MVQIDIGVYFYWALVILGLPMRWVAAAATAALAHEAAHIATVRLLGGRINGIKLHVSGAQITAALDGPIRTAAAALAGPLGSTLLMLLYHEYPELAACGTVQGLFNLLPVNTLDGGRILCCVTEYFWPDRASVICTATENAACILLIGAIIGLLVYWKLSVCG